MKNAIVLTLLTFVASNLSAVTPGELRARRDRLAAAIGDKAIFIALAAPAGDGAYVQNHNFRWLTDLEDPEAALILMPGEEGDFREVIFVRDRVPLREVWDGRRLSHEEVTEKTGVQRVYSFTRFPAFMEAALRGLGTFADQTQYNSYRYTATPAVTSAFRAGELEAWFLLNDRSSAGGTLTPELQMVNDLRARYPELQIRDASSLVHRMREVKSAAELARIRRAVDITVEAQKAAMRRGLDATHEYEVEAAIEHVFRSMGAQRPGFPSIVGSGVNATTLHYETNQEAIPREGLVLTDIGAEFDGYTADVTRTWPADGTFSAPQREIYEAVLRTQDKAIAAMRPGTRFGDVHRSTVDWLGEELLRLGLITENVPAQVRMYFFHGLGHHIGLAVHDVYDNSLPFEPGMAVTAEPGVYVRRADVEASETFRSLPEGDRAKISRALDRYAGIGVRIEDDVIITARGPELISGGAPRTVAEIEAWMAR